MREIKFRVWCKEGPSMLDWDYLINEPDFADFMKGAHVEDAYYSRLMQYTGLKDKNGKEIYEGDILEFSGNVVALGIVKYNENFATFQACNGNSGWLFGNESGTNIEILGNIYENPELVKN